MFDRQITGEIKTGRKEDASASKLEEVKTEKRKSEVKAKKAERRMTYQQ